MGELRDGTWLVKKNTWSPTWRSVITGMKDVVMSGLSWVLGDGRQIRFWSDKWLANKRLVNDSVGLLPPGAEDVLVKDLWRDGRGWDTQKIKPFISENTWLELLSVVLDNVTGARDRVAWGESVNGEFSVKSAFNMLIKNESPKANVAGFYGRIWRVVAPERVRTFLWLVGNQALMTNTERYRRHLGTTAVCQVCNGGYETIIHILRDCPAMLGLWQRIVPQRRRCDFFDQSLLEWVYGNLGDESDIYESTWSTVFAMGVWWACKWRCDNVFGNKGKCRDRTRFVKGKAKEVTMANLKIKEANPRGSRIEVMVGWIAPPSGWFKLNTDGASRGNPGLATAGGVLRDEFGSWCGGFALNIGRCTAPLAELWGVYYGLYIAWEKQLRRVELEVDSELVVGFLKIEVSERHLFSFLVRLCHGFLSRDWIVRISHVYREANRLADGLANYAFSLPIGFHSCIVVPDVVESLLSDDVIGSARPRRVHS